MAKKILSQDQLPSEIPAPQPPVTPPPPVPAPKKSVSGWIMAALFVSIVLAFGVFYYYDDIMRYPLIAKLFSGTSFSKSRSLMLQTTPVPAAPTPTPTPIILLPDEGTKGNYAVSQSSNSKGPSIQKVVFDPLDVKKGQTLTVMVLLSSADPIIHVGGTLTSDTKTTPVTFAQTGTTGTQHTWSASLTVEDTVLYKYILTVSASTVKGDATVTVAPRS